MNGPRKEIEIDSIVVMPRQTLTVWLSLSDHGQRPIEQIQVELRVLAGGKAEIFADGIAIKPFEKWKDHSNDGIIKP